VFQSKRISMAQHRVDHAPKFDEAAVAGALDDSAMMERDCRID
jgi:hypothetical protein